MLSLLLAAAVAFTPDPKDPRQRQLAAMAEELERAPAELIAWGAPGGGRSAAPVRLRPGRLGTRAAGADGAARCASRAVRLARAGLGGSRGARVRQHRGDPAGDGAGDLRPARAGL